MLQHGLIPDHCQDRSKTKTSARTPAGAGLKPSKENMRKQETGHGTVARARFRMLDWKTARGGRARMAWLSVISSFAFSNLMDGNGWRLSHKQGSKPEKTGNRCRMNQFNRCLV